MKMTNEKKAEAKEMNAKYACFEVVSYDENRERKDSRFYNTFGRAYKAANHRAGQGENVELFGCYYGLRESLYCC